MSKKKQQGDAAAAAETSNRSNVRLMKELEHMSTCDNFKNGVFSAELVNDSLYEWNIKLYKVDPDSQLQKDLDKMKASGGGDHILLYFQFKDTFPFEAPFVRIMYPKILGGHVMIAGNLCMELLSKKGWSSVTNIEAVVLQISSMMTSHGARIQSYRKVEGTLDSARRSFAEIEH